MLQHDCRHVYSFQSFGELRNLSKSELAPGNFEFEGISPSLNTICGKDLKYNHFHFHDVTGSSFHRVFVNL